MPLVVTNLSPEPMSAGDLIFHAEHATKLLSKVCFALEADGLFKDYADKSLRRWWKRRKAGKTVDIPADYFDIK